jgi:hypothetical protein
MKCGEAKSLFSPYLDGAVTGTQMHALSRHLDICLRCKREYEVLKSTQQLLTSVGRRKPPADLALRLRVAVSHEAALAKRPRFDGMLVRLQNAVNGLVVPATAGLVSAVIIFGVLMGMFALPAQLQASNEDVPLMLYTAPELQQTAFGMTLNSINGDSLVIEADVDANGRVQDYRIVSDPDDSKDLLPQVKNMLIFTTFRPATSMGRPTSGRAVLSFSKISVKG